MLEVRFWDYPRNDLGTNPLIWFFWICTGTALEKNIRWPKAKVPGFRELRLQKGRAWTCCDFWSRKNNSTPTCPSKVQFTSSFSHFQGVCFVFPWVPIWHCAFPKKGGGAGRWLGNRYWVSRYPQNLDDRESIDPDGEVGEASFEPRCRMIQVY